MKARSGSLLVILFTFVMFTFFISPDLAGAEQDLLPGEEYILKIHSDASKIQISRATRKLMLMGSEVIPAIEKHIDDPDPLRRKRLGYVLGSRDIRRDRRAFKLLEKLLADTEPEVRIAAIGAFAKLGSGPAGFAPAVVKLIYATTDRDKKVRIEAYRALGFTKRKDAVPNIIANFFIEKDTEVKGEILRALGDIKDTRALDIFYDVLHSGSPYEKRIVLRGIYRMGRAIPQKEIQYMIGLLNDEDTTLSRYIIKILRREKKDEYKEIFHRLLYSKNPDISIAAFVALGDYPATEYIKDILDQSNRYEDRQRLILMTHLYKFGHRPEIVAFLTSHLKFDKYDLVRQRAAMSLGRIKAKEAEMALLEALDDPSPYVRDKAAWALGQIKSKKAVSQLISLFHRETNEYVRRSIPIALGEIGSRSALAFLQNLVNDRDKWVCHNALEAIDKIEGKK